MEANQQFAKWFHEMCDEVFLRTLDTVLQVEVKEGLPLDGDRANRIVGSAEIVRNVFMERVMKAEKKREELASERET